MTLEEYAHQANIPTVGMAYVADRFGNEAAIDRWLEAGVLDQVRLNRGEDLLARAALSIFSESVGDEPMDVEGVDLAVARRTMGFVRLAQQGITKQGIELFRPATSEPGQEATQFVADAADYCGKFEHNPLQDLVEKYAARIESKHEGLVLGVGRLLVSAIELAEDRRALKFVESKIKADASRGIKQIEAELGLADRADELIKETEQYLKNQTS